MVPRVGPAAVLFDMGGTLEEVALEPAGSGRGETALLAELGGAGVIQRPLAPGELTARVEEGLNAYKRQMHAEGELRELAPLEIWSRWILAGEGFAPGRLTAQVAEELSFLYETEGFRRSLRPEARPMLEELTRRGYPLGVISNSISLTQVARTLRLHRLEALFGTVQVSALAGRRKPHPAMFLTAAAELHVEPGRCVYVGDTFTRDVLGARAAGYGYALLMRSPLGRETDARDGGDLEVYAAVEAVWERSITSLDEVPGLLAELEVSRKDGVADGYAAS
ncbi:MAG: HAD family hydrolase [Methanocella sp.]